ncbi:hypothetical protein EMCRGX_G010027 [Ephydatia muelleri]
MDSPCNVTLKPAVLVMSGTGGAAALTCLLAVILVAARKLYVLFAYRLALYHVITGLLSGMACVLEAVSILYYDRPDSDDPPSACIAIAFTIQYCVWMKLCFTFWVTFHLFSYAVCYRNLKRLELFWVVVLDTDVHRVFRGKIRGPRRTVCAVVRSLDRSPLPRLHRCRRDGGRSLVSDVCGEEGEEGSPVGHEEAAPGIRPEAAPPSAGLSGHVVPFVHPPLVDRVLGAMSVRLDGLTVANAFCTSAWSLAAGLALITHIALVSTGAKRNGDELSSRPTTNGGDAQSADADSVAYWNSQYGTSGNVSMEAKPRGARLQPSEGNLTSVIT